MKFAQALGANALADRDPLPPQLRVSGIAPPDTPGAAGNNVVMDSPDVGGRMREHRVFVMQFRLTEDLGYNKLLSTAAGQQAAVEQHQTTRSGPTASRRTPTDGVDHHDWP
jgi:hypothetical protein